MKRICFILSLLFLNSIVFAQNSRIKYSGIAGAGILKGSADQNIQLQSINGVKYKTWFAGIGIGMDDYYFKSVPLFFDVRKNLSGKKQTPFLYADAGTNLPWKKEEKGAWQASNYERGAYYEIGMGYAVPLKGRLFFNFSAGYSQKTFHETRTGTGGIIWDFPPYGTNSTEYFDYTFRRIVFRIALQF